MQRRIVFIVLGLLSCISYAQKQYTHDVYFNTDEYIVPPTERSRLLLFISALKDLDITAVTIYGFCDDVGADSYNMKLSQQRANVIKTIFSNHNINESLITNVDGKGEVLLKRVSEKNILNIRGLNRRVEIIVTQKQTEQENVVVDTLPKKPLTVAEQLKGHIKVGDKLTFKNILFHTGYSTVTPNSKKELEKIAKVLVERDDVYFTIQGHVCCTKYTRDAIDRKTKLRNLSYARAKFVHDYFLEKGVDKKRMRFMGMRRKFPLGGDSQFDRRVEILITYVGNNVK